MKWEGHGSGRDLIGRTIREFASRK